MDARKLFSHVQNTVEKLQRCGDVVAEAESVKPARLAGGNVSIWRYITLPFQFERVRVENLLSGFKICCSFQVRIAVGRCPVCMPVTYTDTEEFASGLTIWVDRKSV